MISSFIRIHLILMEMEEAVSWNHLFKLYCYLIEGEKLYVEPEAF